MTYELSTIYDVQTPLSEADYMEAFQTQTDAGATSAVAWLGLTGPYTNAIAMTSRWNSIDQIAKWRQHLATMSAPGGRWHERTASNPLRTRLLSRRLAEGGETSGEYLLVTRVKRPLPADELDARVIDQAITRGASGCRIAQLFLSGEFDGQVIAGFTGGSVDTLVELQQLHADPEISGLVAAAGAEVLSRTIFRRIAATTST